MLQQLNLSQSALRQNLLAEHIRHFLDSNSLARSVVLRRTNDAWDA